MAYSFKGKDPIEQRINKAIKHRDEREDSRSRQINVSWAINAAINWLSREGHDGDLELNARQMLLLFDKLFEERSQEQARRYEVEDNARNAAELEAGE